MTQTSAALTVRPAYRPYLLDVARVERLSPSFVRVTLVGDELEHFGTAGLDQRIKVLFPRADGTISDVGQDDEEAVAAALWYERWRALPTERPQPLPHLHGARRSARAPVSSTSSSSSTTTPVLPGSGRLRPPPASGCSSSAPTSAARIPALASTGAPVRRAVSCSPATRPPRRRSQSIVESLGEGYDVDAFIEVPDGRRHRPCATPRACVSTWLPRSGREHGEALIAAPSRRGAARRRACCSAPSSPLPQELDDIDVDLDLLWDSPDPADGEFYAWFAGEAATIKALRRQLVQGCGVDRRRVAFMGYWRRGQAERME